jgi:hypothetical protein
MSAIRAAVLLLCLAAVAGCSCEIETARVPDGSVNIPYSARLAESSPCGDGVWALVSGTMPPGVSLFSDGRLNGIPNTAGTFSFTAAFQEGGVTGSAGRTAERSFTILIRPEGSIG